MDNDDGGRHSDDFATFSYLLMLLEAYQRLGGDSSDDDDDDIDPAAGDPDNGDGNREGLGDGDLEEEEEEDSEELSQYASFLLANSRGHHDEGGSGQEAELGEVDNGDDVDGVAFTTGAVETHTYEDAIIVGSSGDYSSSGFFLPSYEEFTRAYTSTAYHEVGGGAGASSSLHHGDDELPPDDDSGNNEAQSQAVEQHGDERHGYPEAALEAATRFIQSINGGGGPLDAESMIRRMAPLVATYRARDGQRPASSAAVAALEKRKHGGGGASASPSATGQCVICLEDYEAGDDLSVMPCSDRHSFHQACLADWLARSRLCPLCRHVLSDEEHDDDGDGDDDAHNGQAP
ncbi:hypothetical protein E2562_024385 [Oryza meyeriana var. granulata]|uniref:RING-type domain-containing protein n=1 Tax=Oryza meyeriana var. granulata TaxID=110450 RepID=A0A6G1C8L4_9ORYZ|nr:hypothetical protein E2562_024385 [Oryza meyeriana var. granulata]